MLAVVTQSHALAALTILNNPGNDLLQGELEHAALGAYNGLAEASRHDPSGDISMQIDPILSALERRFPNLIPNPLPERLLNAPPTRFA